MPLAVSRTFQEADIELIRLDALDKVAEMPVGNEWLAMYNIGTMHCRTR